MSDDEKALQACIGASPDDDLPRLVYADWLEERDQGIRAEFIRLQCEIAKLEAGPRGIINQNIPLWRRQQELLDRDWTELIGPEWAMFEGGKIYTRLDRGFVDSIQLMAADFVALAGLIPQVCFVAKQLTVYQFYDTAAAMLSLPILTLNLITSIEFGEFESTLEPIDDLLQSNPNQFVSAAPWTRLQSLNLAQCAFDDAILPQLFPAGAYPALTELDLSHNYLTADGIISLINSGVPQRLTRLVLGGNPIGDQGAFELADRVSQNRGLKHLNLRGTNLSSAGQSALLAKFGGRVDLF